MTKFEVRKKKEGSHWPRLRRGRQRASGKRALSLFSPAGRGNLATRLCRATFTRGYGEPGATAWLGAPSDDAGNFFFRSAV